MLDVHLNWSKTEQRKLGRLAHHQNQILFEYNAGFLADPLPVSPLNLPVIAGVTAAPKGTDSLHGLFIDSLPDAWGRLLVDRAARRAGRQPEGFTVLDRLQMVGESGAGALTYQPASNLEVTSTAPDLDHLAAEALILIAGQGGNVETLDILRQLGGSSGGARPKVQMGLDPTTGYLQPDNAQRLQPWIIKFAASEDFKSSGAIEYAYSQMARAAGVEMADTRLFASTTCSGWFGTARFDRLKDGKSYSKRLHYSSLAGLLDLDYRIPSVGYDTYLKLTYSLTRDMRQVAQAFRRVVFNVAMHNRDDHSKNFGYLMDQSGNWRLAPAFDLMFNYGPGGEHSMDVMGQGRAPTAADLLGVAAKVSLPTKESRQIIMEVLDATVGFKKVLAKAGVAPDELQTIAGYVEADLGRLG